MTDLYAAVEAIATDLGIALMTVCDILEISRSAYYNWLGSGSTARERETAVLAEIIREIFHEHHRRYGARRIASELADRCIVCSPRRVAKILKILGLRAIQPKSFTPKTTQSRHKLGYSPNLLPELGEPSRIDAVWVGDITYLPLSRGGFCFLAALMDHYSRDIVGWSVDSTMTESLTLRTLSMAIQARQPDPGLVHHTDRGGQYAGKEYRAVLRRAGMRQSMSRADNCYDNAIMESCFGTFKKEIGIAEYESVAEAEKRIGDYIRYYRFNRKHSSLGYLSPHQFIIRTESRA